MKNQYTRHIRLGVNISQVHEVDHETIAIEVPVIEVTLLNGDAINQFQLHEVMMIESTVEQLLDRISVLRLIKTT